MAYHLRPPTNEMEKVTLQLHERDLRINSVEAHLQDRTITLARMEARLDYVKNETQAALKTALLARSTNGSLYQIPAGMTTDRQIKRMQNDIERLHYSLENEKYECREEDQNGEVFVPGSSTSTAQTTPSSNPSEGRSPSKVPQSSSARAKMGPGINILREPDKGVLYVDEEIVKSTASGPLTYSEQAPTLKAKSEDFSLSEGQRVKPNFIDYFPVDEVELPVAAQTHPQPPNIIPAVENVIEHGNIIRAAQIHALELKEEKFIGVLIDIESVEVDSPPRSLDDLSSPFSHRTGTPRFNTSDPQGFGYRCNGHIRSPFSDPEKRSPVSNVYHPQRSLAYHPPAGAADVYRTVIIDNLPTSTEMQDILTFAEEYPLVSAQLLDTSKMKIRGQFEGLGTIAMRIEFFYQSSAEQFAFDLSNAMLSLLGRTPRVTHLTSSPTYPVSLAVGTYRDRGYVRTRRIRINQPKAKYVQPRQFRAALEGFSHGYREKGWIIDVKAFEGGKLEVTFNSIETAMYAFLRLRDVKVFEGCDPEFVRDYGEAGDKADWEKRIITEKVEDVVSEGIDASASGGKSVELGEPATQEAEQVGEKLSTDEKENNSEVEEIAIFSPLTQQLDSGYSLPTSPPPQVLTSDSTAIKSLSPTLNATPTPMADQNTNTKLA